MLLDSVCWSDIFHDSFHAVEVCLKGSIFLRAQGGETPE